MPMLNTNCMTLAERQKVEKAVADYRSAFGRMVERAPIDFIFDTLTNDLDDTLIGAHGLEPATRHWQSHLEQRCGTAALRQAQGTMGGGVGKISQPIGPRTGGVPLFSCNEVVKTS